MREFQCSSRPNTKVCLELLSEYHALSILHLYTYTLIAQPQSEQREVTLSTQIDSGLNPETITHYELCKFYLFNKCLLSTYYTLDTILSTVDTKSEETLPWSSAVIGKLQSTGSIWPTHLFLDSLQAKNGIYILKWLKKIFCNT